MCVEGTVARVGRQNELYPGGSHYSRVLISTTYCKTLNVRVGFISRVSRQLENREI